MARCFSVVDNLDGKFVKAIIELPFTGEFVTDGWLPDILAKLHGSHEQLKKSLKFALGIERSDNTCYQFSLFSSNAWLLSHNTQPNVRTNHSQIFGLGKVHRGKRSCVQVRFCTLFYLL